LNTTSQSGTTGTAFLSLISDTIKAKKILKTGDIIQPTITTKLAIEAVMGKCERRYNKQRIKKMLQMKVTLAVNKSQRMK
jgi:hypothetical protein